MGIYHPPVNEHETVVSTALHVVAATHYSRADDPHEDAAYEYSVEQLALAARALAEAVDRKPADEQPIGWTKGREIEQDAIHKHFGLSYANYLVIPRTLLQSMPQEWQHQFVALLKVLEEAFAHVPQADVYDVTAGTENLLRDMTESQLYAACVEVTGDDEMGHGPNTAYRRLSDGEELDGDSYGFMPGEDPVPHYNRGRTRIEPRLGGGE
ncbi:hypothetical protein [Streptomyces sp. NBC_01483]|uniref:hypothetical protein n=1 Tax=Streptomyces sp. NBC_01483 TaxID=2903883 RepID=UPI002E30D10A|nr:hypothetical protein [Streptomyces sp. NBC_01483]